MSQRNKRMLGSRPGVQKGKSEECRIPNLASIVAKDVLETRHSRLVHHSAASRASRIDPPIGTVTNSTWLSRSADGPANDAKRCLVNPRSQGRANQSNAAA